MAARKAKWLTEGKGRSCCARDVGANLEESHARLVRPIVDHALRLLLRPLAAINLHENMREKQISLPTDDAAARLQEASGCERTRQHWSHRGGGSIYITSGRPFVFMERDVRGGVSKTHESRRSRTSPRAKSTSWFSTSFWATISRKYVPETAKRRSSVCAGAVRSPQGFDTEEWELVTRGLVPPRRQAEGHTSSVSCCT